MRTSGLGLSAETSTSGVFPIKSRTLEKTGTAGPAARYLRATARDAGRIVIAVAREHLGLELVQVTHVVVVEKDVDELVELAIRDQELSGHPRVLALQDLEKLANRRSLNLDDRCPPAYWRSTFGKLTTITGPLRKVDCFQSDTSDLDRLFGRLAPSIL